MPGPFIDMGFMGALQLGKRLQLLLLQGVALSIIKKSSFGDACEMFAIMSFKSDLLHIEFALARFDILHHTIFFDIFAQI